MSEKSNNNDFIEADLYLDEPLYIDLDEPVELPVKKAVSGKSVQQIQSFARQESDQIAADATQPIAASAVTQPISDMELQQPDHIDEVVDLADAVGLADVEAAANAPLLASSDALETSGAEAEVVAAEIKELEEPLDPVSARRVAHGLSPLATAGNASKNATAAKTSNAANTSTASPEDGGADSDGTTADNDKALSPEKRRAEKFRDDRKAERDEKEKKARRKRIIKAVLIIFIVLIIAIAIAFVASLAFLRWGMLDESQAIKGTWRSSTSAVPTEITITDDRIVLTDDVAYKYAIDTDAKTLVFTFGNLEGHARYRLSLDGRELSIYDTKIDDPDTFFEDAPWLAENLWALILNKDLPSADLGAGSELLKRVE